MKWKTYTLKKKVNVRNSVGQLVPSWSEIQDIKVMVSTNLYSTVTNDVVYRKYAISGVTTYKDFVIKDTYMIECDDHSYELESFNNEGRYTQLLLKEVVL